MTEKIYQGGCHCGAVRFEVKVRDFLVYDCNCSICRKKGFLHLIVPQQDFTILQGEDCLTTYTFNTGIAKHNFCQICGMHSFYRPRSHPEGFDINLRCLDTADWSDFTIEPFDGVNWEDNLDQIRD